MSYTKSFAALTGAAALSAQMATAAPQDPIQGFESMSPYAPVEEVSSAEQTAFGIFMLNAIIPSEVKPLLKGAEISARTSTSINQDGNFDSLFADLDVTNIDCEALGAFYTLYGPSDADKKYLPPEDLMVVEGIEALLSDRHFSLSENFSKADLTAEDLEGMPSQEIALIPENVTLRLEASCSDYVAPPPTFTPVEPN